MRGCILLALSLSWVGCGVEGQATGPGEPDGAGHADSGVQWPDGRADDPLTKVDQGASPSDQGAPPSDQGALPSDQGAPPADQGAPPADQGAPPVDQGTPPADQGTPPADQGTPPADQGAAPPICNELLAGGLVKNPGCDPEVEASGLDAIDSVTLNGVTSWLMFSGNRYWSFDQSNNQFNGGGAVGALLRQVAPDCTAKTADGIALNPGCDPQVQFGGIDAIGSATTAAGTTWLLTRGRKFWLYDGAQGTFTGGGSDIASFLRALPPDCTAKTADNIALNPGCDPDVQARGITTIDATTDAEDRVGWLMLSGRKYWTFDLTKGEFTGGGRSIADFMVTLSADCGATSDGLVRNPGCDATVKLQGLSGLSSVTVGGKTSWLLLSGNRYWTYGERESGDVGFGGGRDFAGFLRQLPVAP